MKRNLTPEQLAARDAKRAKFRALARTISKMSPTEREAMAAKLPGVVTIEGHALSPFNTCLVVMQFPSASLVGGFRQWLKHGRCVVKGQHGISIWVPCGARKSDADPAEGDSDGERPGFICGTVFDVSQTQEIAAGDGEAIELQPEMPKLVEVAA